MCMHGKEENTANFTCLPTQSKLKWNGKLKIIIIKGDEFMSAYETMGMGVGVCVSVFMQQKQRFI